MLRTRAALAVESASSVGPRVARRQTHEKARVDWGLSLVHRSMKDFAISVNEKSMDHFRNTTAQLWQQQASVDQLNSAFGPIVEAGVDLRVLDEIEPTIDGEGTVDDNGVLLVTGTFPTQPSQVHFEHRYILRGRGLEARRVRHPDQVAVPTARASTGWTAR